MYLIFKVLRYLVVATMQRHVQIVHKDMAHPGVMEIVDGLLMNALIKEVSIKKVLWKPRSSLKQI